MKKSFLLSVALLAFSSGAFAQIRLDVEETKQGPYLTNRFFDNWFISVGAGIQLYWGEQDSHGNFGQRIRPNLDVAVGKWVTPSVGFRLMYSGLQAKGYTTHPDQSYYATGRPDADGYYQEKFNLNYLHFDITWNASNAIGGYRYDRTWDFVFYTGFGWANANREDRQSSNELAANIGLLNKIRLSDHWDLNFDLRMMFVNQRFEGVAYGSRAEYVTSASLGFAYNFPRNNFRRPSDVIAIDNSAFDARINALERDLAASQARANQLAKDLEDCRNRTPERVVENKVLTPDMAIFFVIDRAEISEKEMINIEFMANIIKQTPDTKYVLVGSADKETGTPPYNMELSRRRTQNVYDALVKFGVNPNQLTIDAQGDTNNRFPKPYLNRVVIVEN